MYQKCENSYLARSCTAQNDRLCWIWINQSFKGQFFNKMYKYCLCKKRATLVKMRPFTSPWITWYVNCSWQKHKTVKNRTFLSIWSYGKLHSSRRTQAAYYTHNWQQLINNMFIKCLSLNVSLPSNIQYLVSVQYRNTTRIVNLIIFPPRNTQWVVQ